MFFFADAFTAASGFLLCVKNAARPGGDPEHVMRVGMYVLLLWLFLVAQAFKAL